MHSRREEVLRRLERFRHTIRTSATFTIFSKPERPEPELENKLTSITDLTEFDHLEDLVQEFNTRFTPCRIEYTLESRITASGESDTPGHSQAEAMGKLADELDLSDEFDAACIAADEASDQEPVYVFQERLMKAFAERWVEDHKDAYLSKISEQGFMHALELRDLERMVDIMSVVNKPVFLAFWHRINELTGNTMDPTAITSLVEQNIEAGRNAVAEILQGYLSKVAVARV